MPTLYKSTRASVVCQVKTKRNTSFLQKGIENKRLTRNKRCIFTRNTFAIVSTSSGIARRRPIEPVCLHLAVTVNARQSATRGACSCFACAFMWVCRRVADGFRAVFALCLRVSARSILSVVDRGQGGYGPPRGVPSYRYLCPHKFQEFSEFIFPIASHVQSHLSEALLLLHNGAWNQIPGGREARRFEESGGVFSTLHQRFLTTVLQNSYREHSFRSRTSIGTCNSSATEVDFAVADENGEFPRW